MTDWDAADYAQVSALQKVMADQALGLLHLKGSEHVLDVGCGDGKITAEIAVRLPRGSVLGVDSSAKMVAYARSHWASQQPANLKFEIADVRRMPFQEEFDTVVSFNALHWIPQAEQQQALASIRSAMKPRATAQLRLVPKGERKSLENILEETRLSPRWAPYYAGFHDPYLHLAPEAYAALAHRVGFQVRSLKVNDEAWDFHSPAAFYAFGSVTFVEWTRMLPEVDKPAFINDVLERYRAVSGDDHTFKFYQMDITLERP